MERKQLRDNRGAAIISLCLVLSLFMIFIVFFAFDMNRLQMAQRQVTAICDAAALSGSAMLTSKDTAYENTTLDTLYTTQLAAIEYTKNMLAMGNILGAQCYDPAVSSAPTNGIALNYVASESAVSSPSPHHLNCFVQLCSPVNNYAIVPAGNSSARAIYIQAAFGYVPFMSILGVSNVVLPSTSTSSLQKLCVIMVFDCSGSMDDATRVSFVERRWTQAGDNLDNNNGGKGCYVYQVVGSPGGGAGAAQLWQYAGLNYTSQPNGTAVNVLPPQNLDYLGLLYANRHYAIGNSDSAFNQVNPPLAFDVSIAHYIPWPAGLIPGTYNYSLTTVPVSGSGFQGPYYDNHYGTPPGNCRVKYGVAGGAGAQYGGNTNSASEISNPNRMMNIWDGVSTTVRPGPSFSPGYYNTATSNPGYDHNLYFYDPNSMPAVNTNTNYTAFTDLVANIMSVSQPVTQPLYGPVDFTGFTHVFPTNSVAYKIPIADTASTTLTNNGYYELDPTLNNRSFPFTSIAFVVEAARGNLDIEWNATSTGTVANTFANYDNALLNYGNNSGGTMVHPARANCRAGYQKAYQRLAMFVMQPYATAVDGASRFFQNLCQTGCCNFGLVGFSVAPAATANYGCAYISSVASGYYSLGLTAPTDTARPTAVYSSYVDQPPQPWGGTRVNPNFWVTLPVTTPPSSTDRAPSGPAGNPTGAAYHATLNTLGPTKTTWLKVNGGNPPSNSNTQWACNTGGFQIPRFNLNTNFTQSQAYYGVAGDYYAPYSFTTSGTGGIIGGNGLNHARPLYETAGLEALKVALYNLTDISALDSMVGNGTGISLPTKHGLKKAIVFFTDGLPTDDSSPFDAYKTQVVNQAQSKGVAIFSVGLALNDNVKVQQYIFLKNLANRGACGSQHYQVTSNSSLTSTFTGIARTMAQSQR